MSNDFLPAKLLKLCTIFSQAGLYGLQLSFQPVYDFLLELCLFGSPW